MGARSSINGYLDDFLRRGRETAYVQRRGLRTERWSYRRVAETAFRTARELEARGVSKGERVMLWGANSAEWVAAFFGCALRGAVVVPLDVESAPDFVARVRAQVGARLTFAGSDVPRQPDALALEDLALTVAHHSAAPYDSVETAPEDLLEIIYTSGTTDEPRGVTLAHRNFLANLAPLEEEIARFLRWERLVHPLRFLNLVPLSHVFGQFMGIFVPQLLGGEVHFQDSLNPSEVVETVRRRRVSVVVAVPRLLETLREYVERQEEASGARDFAGRVERAARLSPWRRWWEFRRAHRRFGLKFWAFVTGGATLPEETEKFWRRLGFAVLQGYGMTETASLIAVNHPFKSGRGSVGRTLPGQEIKLGEGGEILVRGANVSPGYWAGGVRPIADADGWLRTGDLGEMDAEGNIFFKGRRKDVIVTDAGLNIHPEDLEAALARQTEVRLCTVVRVEGVRGDEPLAVLILKDEKADAARAVERANEGLARHQQIRRWAVWPEQDFPRTPTRKVRKRDVVARLKADGVIDGEDAGANAFAGGASRPAGRGLEPVISSLVTRHSSLPLDSSAKLSTDLKLDSLARVELLSAIEDRYQIELDEAAFTAATTVGDIEKIVREGAAASDAPARYPYPRWAQRPPFTWLRLALLYAVVLPITSILCWVRVRGREQVEAARGPVLFVSNHVTFVDHALILSALPGRFRRRFAIAQEGERLRWWRRAPAGTPPLRRLRWLAQYFLVVLFFNTFSLPQKSGFRRSFAYAGESVDRGFNLLVFPEGTRTDDGALKPFMGGTGILATKLGVPVVPVRIEGLFELKRRGRKFFAPPGSVTVTFGEAVKFAPTDDPADAARELERRVAAL
ncbi:MAG TPA: AMP-binding protein [Pyrinomonadaceae bacterium]|nr:AMP-binding protein [Pyrinomonadaceae bacterium]